MMIYFSASLRFSNESCLVFVHATPRNPLELKSKLVVPGISTQIVLLV